MQPELSERYGKRVSQAVQRVLHSLFSLVPFILSARTARPQNAFGDAVHLLLAESLLPCQRWSIADPSEGMLALFRRQRTVAECHES